MKINKRNLLISAFLLIGLAMGAKCVYTDLWGVQGLGAGIFYNKDIARVDKDGNFRLYSGNIVLGDNGTIPSTTQLSTTAGGVVSTVNGYEGIKVPFYNNSSASTAIGSLMEISLASTSAITATMGTAVATTTILGVSDGIYASGSIGYMTISGYALVLATGTVKIGDILVSTVTAGYTGSTTGTQVVGTGVGKALAGNTSGTSGLIPVAVNIQ